MPITATLGVSVSVAGLKGVKKSGKGEMEGFITVLTHAVGEFAHSGWTDRQKHLRQLVFQL